MDDEWKIQPIPLSGRPLPIDDPGALKAVIFGKRLSREDLERRIGNPLEER